MRATFLPLFLLSIALPSAADATWSHDAGENNLICGAPDYQGRVCTGRTADGSTVVAWSDQRDHVYHYYDIYAQCVGTDGSARWVADGVELWSDYYVIVEVAIAGDAEGGAVFLGYGGGGIEARLLDSTGEEVWGSGALVAEEVGELTAIEDGQGGIMTTFVRQGGIANRDVYAQRLSADGELLWPEGAPAQDGVLISDSPYDEQHCQIISDGATGAFVLWKQNRSGSYALIVQRMDASGNPMWSEGGIRVYWGPMTFEQAMAPDGEGGVIIVWDDDRGETRDIYAQRVSAQGNLVWIENGIPVCIAPASQVGVKAIPDGDGGAIAVWHNFGGDALDYLIAGQRISPAGTLLWPEDGIPLAPRDGVQREPDLIADGSGGAIALWTEHDEEDDLIAQRISGSGARLWGSEGLVVASANGDQSMGRLVGDGEGNAVAVWQDERSGELDIYAQRIDAHGYLGWPGAHSLEVTDVPGDQGGAAVLNWHASYLDVSPGQTVTEYSVWMKHEDLEDWELVDQLDAEWSSEYSCVVPTSGDSTAWSVPPTEYRVTTHTAENDMSWVSSPVTGWSVDNLAPGAPVGVVASVFEEDVLLSWTPSGQQDEDLFEYSVYRSDASGLPVGEMTLVSSTPDSFLTDADPGAGTWFYVVTAEDVHGNESEPSAEVSAIVETPLPLAFALRSSYPNPFSASARIEYDLPTDADVELKVFDVGGRLVTVLHDGPASAGTKREVWHGTDGSGLQVASGVYYCLLRAPGVEKRIRMTLVR